MASAVITAPVPYISEAEPSASHPFFGLFLSVVSACLVGSSFIFQKKGIIHSNKVPRKGTLFHL